MSALAPHTSITLPPAHHRSAGELALLLFVGIVIPLALFALLLHVATQPTNVLVEAPPPPTPEPSPTPSGPQQVIALWATYTPSPAPTITPSPKPTWDYTCRDGDPSGRLCRWPEPTATPYPPVPKPTPYPPCPVAAGKWCFQPYPTPTTLAGLWS